MLPSQPEQPTKINGRRYFYIAGLLSGICFTFIGLSGLATIRADHVDAALFMGGAGLLVIMMGLFSFAIISRVTRHLPAEQRIGQARLSIFWTPLGILPFGIICEGLGFFSQNLLQLLLGTSSLIPNIIGGLFIGGGLLLLVLLVKRLTPFYERVKEAQAGGNTTIVPED